MVIGILELSLRIDRSHSLKEKRMIINSLKDRLRNNFNIAVSETDSQDKWQTAQLGIVTVNADKKYANRLLSKVIDFLHGFPEAELLDYRMEFI
jgi:uncharacterized protein YlxP (DUF503 family)